MVSIAKVVSFVKKSMTYWNSQYKPRYTFDMEFLKDDLKA